MLELRYTVRDAKLQQVISASPRQAADLVEATARAGQAYVMDSFGSEGSPAPEGAPPGIDTGALKNSITVDPRGQFTRAIVAGTDYAPHLEFGTSKMGGRPFMLPMAVWLESQIEDLWKDFIE